MKNGNNRTSAVVFDYSTPGEVTVTFISQTGRKSTNYDMTNFDDRMSLRGVIGAVIDSEIEFSCIR